jgi:peptide/nickel transport system ATP-binding protein
MDPDRRTEEAPLAGDPPNPINPPSGCRFHPRCPFAEGVCSTERPALLDSSDDGSVVARHLAACHMANAGSGHSKASAVQTLEPAP